MYNKYNSWVGQMQNPNVAAIAWQFNVFTKKLINWWKERKSKIKYRGHNKALSKAQELVLCQYFDSLNRKRPKTCYKQLKLAVNAFFKKKHTKSGKPSIVEVY